MLKNINTAYDGTSATIEIVIMLAVAFILGFLLCRTIGNNTDKQSSSSTDDLKIVEGIGPKVEALLKESGVKDLKQLSQANSPKLKEILMRGGGRFELHDTSTWVDQASLAVSGKFDELEQYQNLLITGKAV